jgi:hypothetical protein
MLRTTNLDLAGILVALGLGRISGTLPPQDGERLVTIELTISDANLERAQSLEHDFDTIGLVQPDGTSLSITLGDFLDGVQRARRAMRGARAVQR